jgi:hypothetical protein
MIGKIALFALLILAINANLHLNIKYRNVLEGNDPLTDRLARAIFE